METSSLQKGILVRSLGNSDVSAAEDTLVTAPETPSTVGTVGVLANTRRLIAMGRRVKCPGCGHEFWLHGRGTGPDYSVVDCYECGAMFNPRKQSGIPQGAGRDE